MDPLSIQPVLLPSQPPIAAPAPAPAPAAASSAPVDRVTLNTQTQAPILPEVAIANPHILGDATYAMFTVNGKLYTRVSNKVDGIVKETYLPAEPPLDIKV